MKENADRYKAGERVSWGATLGNLALVAFKLIAGVVGNSAAMVADAVHSASDILATLGVIASFKISKLPPDDDHPYGHGKAESVAAKLVGVILIAAGLSIAVSAVRNIVSGSFAEPATVALVAAVVSIVTKELMYRVTAITAQRIHSSALMAEAKHHRSDAYSSIGTCIGIFGARHGLAILDPLAGLVVACFVIAMGWQTLRASAQELMDAQLDTDMLTKIGQAAMAVDGVEDIHSLAVRRYGGSYHVDLRIGADPDLSLVQSHDITIEVESAIKKMCQRVVGVLVHVDPESVHQEDPSHASKSLRSYTR